MSATAEQIASLRLKIAEPTDAIYTDENLGDFIENRAVRDTRGVSPMILDFATYPPTQTVNPDWIETYDLNAAAADIWDLKSAAAAGNYSFEADGASFDRAQIYSHCCKMAGKFRSRSIPGSISLIASRRERTEDGAVIQTTPIIEQSQESQVFNAAI